MPRISWNTVFPHQIPMAECTASAQICKYERERERKRSSGKKCEGIEIVFADVKVRVRYIDRAYIVSPYGLLRVDWKIEARARVQFWCLRELFSSLFGRVSRKVEKFGRKKAEELQSQKLRAGMWRTWRREEEGRANKRRKGGGKMNAEHGGKKEWKARARICYIRLFVRKFAIGLLKCSQRDIDSVWFSWKMCFW